VHEHRHAPLGGQAEYADDLVMAGCGGVLDAHADAESAGIELLAQAPQRGLELLLRSGVVCGRAGGRKDLLRGQGGAEHRGASREVTGRGAIVDQ
jgi:hypothetical protein